MVLFEQDVDSLEEGKTYCFEGLTVKKYDMYKHLSLGQNGTKHNCEDIGEVSEEDVLSSTEDIASSSRYVSGDISCVISCSEYAPANCVIARF